MLADAHCSRLRRQLLMSSLPLIELLVELLLLLLLLLLQMILMLLLQPLVTLQSGAGELPRVLLMLLVRIEVAGGAGSRRACAVAGRLV